VSDRLQKLLADAGVASRRQIESWITEGRITVNGRPAEIGQKATHEDRIRVDGKPVALQRKAEPPRVLVYRKQVGEVVTRQDPEGRRTVFRKLPPLTTGRWITVGRLDVNTSGLLLLTNHGELARRLMHPSFEVNREYAVRVLGEVTPEIVHTLTRDGVDIDGHRSRFDTLRPGINEDGEGANQWWTVTLHEGRHREVRRLFESQGLQVSRLIRTVYGPIALGRGIRSSGFREATPAELRALLAAVQLEVEAPPAGGGKPRGKARAVPPPEAVPAKAARGRKGLSRADKPERAAKAKTGGKAVAPWHQSRKRAPKS
jgi:23S rRNA pseudouridine2605 synthase